MTVSKEKQEAIDLYAAIMEEIRVRIGAIDAGTGGSLPALPSAIVQEHCHLQLRMCCELIGLGCLVAHGDITSAGMQRAWSAEKIFASLEALHPNFFPVPVTVQRLRTHFHMVPQQNPLTKSETLSLYANCGNRLHRGNLKKLLAQGRIPIQVNYPEITASAQKIVDLLSSHMVALYGGNEVIVCSLNARGSSRVSVAIANRAEPPQEVRQEASDHQVT